jgi:hypothetical protein
MFTVKERILAIVQKAGRNLKGHRLRSGAGVEETVGGGGGVVTGRGLFAPFRGGSLEWIESSMFPEINFFILLDSSWLEAGVAIESPHCDGAVRFPKSRVDT